MTTATIREKYDTTIGKVANIIPNETVNKGDTILGNDGKKYHIKEIIHASNPNATGVNIIYD